MNARDLSNLSYPRIRRLIDTMTIEMYQDITESLLHDTSPLELATTAVDIWQKTALSLQDNTKITHSEYFTCITRIMELLDRCCNSLGIETDLY